MRISIFGLGYVGTVSAACFAARGHVVVGVDPNRTKVDLINSGRPPLIEKRLPELVEEAVREGRLSATTEAAAAVAASDLSIICVGTPSGSNGSIDLSGIERVCSDIGAALAAKSTPHTVVVRSTILPGTFRGVIVPTLERFSGKTQGDGLLRVVTNPEFLREGTAVADFDNPPKTVIGADDEDGAAAVAALYEGLPGAVIRTRPEVAEVIKYVDNPWHALKVAFANEIGNVCQAVGVDSHAVMDIFLADTKLNISPAYLKPGFAYGGSCLPKDVRAICYHAQQLDLDVPVLKAINASNRHQIERAAEKILSLGGRRVGVLGCSFKADTDDLRESPYVGLIEILLGKGCKIRIYDENVRLSLLMGGNRDYIYGVLPHIAELIADTADELIDESDVVLLTSNSPDYLAAASKLGEHQHLVDFARMPASSALTARSHAVNW